jgi:sensor histidine kinase YesM
MLAASAAGFWTFIAVLYSLQIWWLASRGERINLRDVLIWQVTYYVAWIPFTLTVWRLSSNWLPESLGWSRFLLRHLALAGGVAIAHSTLVTLVAQPLSSENVPAMQMVLGQLRGRLHMQLLIYAAIAGTGHALVLYERYRERQTAAVRLEAQLAAAQLESLRSQLQPHFLFNSLHTIASLARAGDNAGVVRLIADFSELLRHGLDTNGRKHQSVREEIQLVERYLAIQRVRFEDRLSVCVNVAPDVAHAKVPLLIVQPLVENALRHGLGPRVGPGSLHVTAMRSNGRTLIEVEDDGLGLPEGWTMGAGTGTGLKNLAARLLVEYGHAASLTVSPRQGGGVVARVALPAGDV